MSLIRRDYQGADDLRLMQGLVQRLWTRRSFLHIGDLAWQRDPRAPDVAQPTALWFDGETLVGWIWRLAAEAHVLFDPAFAGILPDALNWAVAQSPDASLAISALEGDRALMAALTETGFVRDPAVPFDLQAFRDLEDLPPMELPPGFSALTQAELGNVERKAAGHRAAWSRLADYDPEEPPLNSRVSTESYREMMATWPYRPELDLAILSPDGRVAASACTWLDEDHGVGLFEPVGVDPDFRRLGLARAICAFGLAALKAAGARLALVKPRGDDAYPVPRYVYKSMGFVVEARTYVFVRRPSRRSPRPSPTPLF